MVQCLDSVSLLILTPDNAITFPPESIVLSNTSLLYS